MWLTARALRLAGPGPNSPVALSMPPPRRWALGRTLTAHRCGTSGSGSASHGQPSLMVLCDAFLCHTTAVMQRSQRVQTAFLFTLLMSIFVLISIVLRAQVTVNIVAIAGTLISATTLYLLLAAEPTEEKINSAVIELAAALEDNWGSRMTLLLGRDTDLPAASQPQPANLKFSRVPELELTSQPDLPPCGDWDTVFEDFYEQVLGGRLVIIGKPGFGKTLLAIKLVLQILRARSSTNSTNSKLPVPVSVSGLGWGGGSPDMASQTPEGGVASKPGYRKNTYSQTPDIACSGRAR